MKSLAVSIKSKSSSKVHLCWKEGKQDVSRNSKHIGENIATLRNPP